MPPAAEPAPGAPHHVAIILDGNGRWAERRGWPRRLGHRAGATAVRRTVRAAPELGVRVLTLYAFSSDNWARPAEEVDHLMDLLRRHLESEAPELAANGVRLEIIGRRDRLPAALLETIAAAEETTAAGRRLHLRVAVDYSARDAILRAAGRLGQGPAAPTRADFALALADGRSGTPVPDVDLLVRTGGEQRLSDFLLWECAYAELLFLECCWPDFDREALADAVATFSRRSRRYGTITRRAVS